MAPYPRGLATVSTYALARLSPYSALWVWGLAVSCGSGSLTARPCAPCLVMGATDTTMAFKGDSTKPAACTD